MDVQDDTQRNGEGKKGKALLDFNIFPLKPGGLCSKLKQAQANKGIYMQQRS